MTKEIDLAGQRFEKLVAVCKGERKATPKGKLLTTWVCKCDCGNTVTVPTQALRSGNTKSCGCLQKLDLTGMKFGRLTVLEESSSLVSPKGKKSTTWKCRCECGQVVCVRTELLRNGKTRSCGCLNSEVAFNKSMTHGRSNTHIYDIWCGMISRCKNKNYENYGGRGICVCDEWKGEHGFENFYKWAMEDGYVEGKKRSEQSLDRIDVNGNYCPENCRWTSYLEQQNNRRNNKLIEYKGEIRTLAEWCRELGIGYSKTELRLKRGWGIDEAFEKP